jgi:biotin carboxyl carrier protein
VRFKVDVDGSQHQIVTGADGGLTLDGETFAAKVTRPAADRLMVQVGDKSHEVRVIEGGAESGSYVLELAGERIPVTVSDLSRGGLGAARAAAAIAPATVSGGRAAAATTGRAAAATTGPVQPLDDVKEGIWAPMPGKIVDVLIDVGDTVEAGEGVLILEAMKMENELRAHKKGTVTSVLVKRGDSVERGQLLVALE